MPSDAGNETASLEAALQELAAAPNVDPRTRVSRLPLEPGETVAGTFRIERKVGEGGMGEVYLATDIGLERPVALKMQLPGARASLETERLHREAKAMAALSHPNIVPIHEVGEHRGRTFIAMEYVDGSNVRAWLERAPRSWREILGVFSQAGAGLAAAHRAGLVHRDVKPDNILVGTDGRVRVGDFGLARATPTRVAIRTKPGVSPTVRSRGADTARHTVTLGGAVVGSPPYMSPEHYGGGTCDARSDQFSFCVSLFESLFGVRPFFGEHPRELLPRIGAGAVEPVSRRGVPRHVHRALLVGLRSEPEQRHPSMEELLSRIRPRTPLLVWGAGLGVIVVAGAASLSSTTASSECADGGTELEQIWTPARQDSLAQHLSELDAAWAAEAANVADSQLAEYAGRWKEAWQRACEATAAAGNASDRLVDLRAACLERRASSFTALVESLDGLDRKRASSLIQKVEDLESIDACLDGYALATAPPLPEDSEQRREVLSLRVELGRIDDARRHGLRQDHERGLAEVGVLLRRAQRVDDRPSVGHARLLRQVLRRSLDEPVQLEEAHAAFNVGLATGAHELAVAAAHFLVRTYRSRDPEQAIVWADTARAAIERLPDPTPATLRLLRREIPIYLMTRRLEVAEQKLDELDAVLDRAAADSASFDRYEAIRMRAHVQMHRQEFDAAIAGLQRAEAVLADRVGPDHPFLGNVKREIGGLLIMMNRPSEAKVVLLDAKSLLEAHHGPGHSTVALVTGDIAQLMLQGGDFEGTIALVEPAIETMKASPSDARVAYVQALSTYAIALTQVGRTEDAVAALRLGVDAVRPAGIPSKLGGLLSTLSFTLNEVGDHAAAESAAMEAVSIFEEGEDAVALAGAIESLARSHRRLGRFQEAITGYERAYAIREEVGHGTYELVSFLHGLALAQRGLGDLAAFRATIERGMAMLTEDNPVADDWRKTLSAELAAADD